MEESAYVPPRGSQSVQVENLGWKCVFLLDKWLEECPIGAMHEIVDSPNLKVKECQVDNEWDMALLTWLLGYLVRIKWLWY